MLAIHQNYKTIVEYDLNIRLQVKKFPTYGRQKKLIYG